MGNTILYVGLGSLAIGLGYVLYKSIEANAGSVPSGSLGITSGNILPTSGVITKNIGTGTSTSGYTTQIPTSSGTIYIASNTSGNLATAQAYSTVPTTINSNGLVSVGVENLNPIVLNNGTTTSTSSIVSAPINVSLGQSSTGLSGVGSTANTYALGSTFTGAGEYISSTGAPSYISSQAQYNQQKALGYLQ